MARLDRALRPFEARAASIASRHVRGEHVDAALVSLARKLGKRPDLHTLDLSDIDDTTLDAHFAAHAARHPDRVVAAAAPTQTEAPRSLASAQDAAIAARTPSVRSRTGTNGT